MNRLGYLHISLTHRFVHTGPALRRLSLPELRRVETLSRVLSTALVSFILVSSP